MSKRVWIKICGLTTEAAVAAAIDARVDAIGFVFAPSKRRVTPQRAVQLAREVPSTISRVAVFLHPSQAQLDEVCETLRPDVIQTDLEDLASLRVPREIGVHPVMRAGAALPTTLPRRLLFEGPVSGTGEIADWSQAQALARRTQLILAGGLSAQNVAEAIRTVDPFGVDVSSGVESSAGIKDPVLIGRFAAAVREAQDAVVA